MPLPTFLLVGAQKSGTTLLTHYLRAHPLVSMPKREGQFFNRRYDLGLEYYQALFNDRPARGESTPEYLFHPHLPGLIAQTVPDVRILSILRDPVGRAYSHYWHNRSRGHEPLDFEAAVDAEPERTGDGRSFADQARYSYLARGRYIEQLLRFESTFGRERMLTLLLGDLTNGPLETLNTVFAFLGVHQLEEVKAIPRQNPFVEFRSHALRKPIQRLPMPLRRVAVRLNERVGSYPPMAPETGDRLRARFAEPNAALGLWLGRSLADWSR